MSQDEEAARSVIIVDDDPGFTESLIDLLQPRGFAVSCFDTAEHAITALRAPPEGVTPPPVALIDVRLGGDSGVDLIPRLSAAQPGLICVLMTTSIDSQTAIAALRRGAYDYFDKTWDPDALFGVLDRCFDRVALLRNRAAYEALRLAKEKAEAANRAKSAFLTTMSHELRTPLNAIIGFSEMMVNEVQGSLANEHYRSYVADIHESGTHLLQIINDILDLSRAEDGKLELDEGVFDLRDTIRSVRRSIGALIGDRDLSISVELPAGLPLLRADERMTRQVLLKLAANGVKFTPSGGQVQITSRFDPATGLIVTVSDTGIGIAPRDLARVIEPFEQADSSITRSHQGSGLGLPLVKAIMELHGGTLALNSKLGAGTQASVTFPLERAVFDPLVAHSLTAA